MIKYKAKQGLKIVSIHGKENGVLRKALIGELYTNINRVLIRMHRFTNMATELR